MYLRSHSKQTFIFGVRVLGLLGISCLFGCTSVVPGYPREERTQVPTQASIKRNIPVKLAVVREENDGHKVHILAEVSSLTAWPVSDLVLEVKSFVDGVDQHIERFPLARYASSPEDLLEPATPLNVAFSIDAQASDYQVSVLWGKDAQRFQDRDPTKRLALEDISVIDGPSCTSEPCRPSYIITGSLRNVGKETINRATLGIGLVGRDTKGLSATSKEKQVEVPGLDLVADESQPIRLIYDLERDSAEGMEPRVRVIEVD